MGARNQEPWNALRIASDLVSVVTAWFLAYFLRFHTWLESPKGIPDFPLYAKLVPFIVVIWLGVYGLAGLYRRSGSHRSAILESLDIVRTSILATLAFIVFTYFYAEYRYSRVVLVIFGLLQPPLVIAGRSLLRKMLRYVRRKTPPRAVLLIGSAQIFREVLQWRPAGIEKISAAMPVGDPEECKAAALAAKEVGIEVLDVPQDWITFFSSHDIHKVTIALPARHYDFIDRHLEEITNQISNVQVVPDLARFARFAAGVEMVGGAPVIQIHDIPMSPMGMLLKRACDLIGASLGLALFSPVLLVAAFLIRLTSRGPILYRQERMGIDGRRFTLLKLRSMPVNAESSTGAIWATPQDNRATPLGKFLRRTSLDELPQLFNVLRGEMSLVGPRPERPVFVNDFRRKIPGYMLRHKVKAGLTGWAQVNGWRGDTSLEKRIECDLYYVQHWSIWLDFKIIFLTVFNGFINKNAY